MIEIKEPATSRRQYKGASADQRQAGRRKVLIETSIRLYGELGYRNVSNKAVCQAAGLTDRYFYESFPDSEALLISGFETVTRWLIGSVEATGEDIADPLDRTRAKLAAYYSALRDQPSSARLFLVEIMGVAPAVDAAFDASLDRFANLILRTLDPRGLGSGADDRLLRRAVTSGLLGLALAWIAEDYASPIQEVVQTGLKLCLLLSGPDLTAQPSL
jgi:AcrR family transcriptional regulator